MITLHDFGRILDALGKQGRDDVEWAENCRMPADADGMALEIIFVICNSGMKHTVAQGIFNRCRDLLTNSKPVKGNVLGKSGKAAAIDEVWRDRVTIFDTFTALQNDETKLAYLAALPWIGDITKYHLAKNFGMQVAKPDVHLQRLADLEGCTPQQLCERLSRDTVYCVATVDTILWRACATGVLSSRTGRLAANV